MTDDSADGAGRTRARYGFEPRRHHRFRDRCMRDAAVFLGRIVPGRRLSDLVPEDRERILDCVETHTYNIYWYARAVRRERALKWVMFLGTGILLFAIPGSIFWLADLGVAEGTIVGQLGIVLTGVFALHKTMVTWIEKRKYEGQFWGASHELKASLYELHGAYDGRIVVGVGEAGRLAFPPEFRGALEEAARRARNIVDEETRRYFDSYTVPRVELSPLTGGIDPRKIVARLYAPGSEHEEARRGRAEAAAAAVPDSARRRSPAGAGTVGTEPSTEEERVELAKASSASGRERSS